MRLKDKVAIVTGGGSGIGEAGIAGRGDAGFVAERLGEGLGAFQLGRRPAGSEDAQARALKPIDHAQHQRRLGSDDDAVDFFRVYEFEESLLIVSRNGDAAAVLGDAPVLVLLAHDEARDVLQEDERDLLHRAELDEVRALARALREEDAVVGEDSPGEGQAGDLRRDGGAGPRCGRNEPSLTGSARGARGVDRKWPSSCKRW